MKYSITAKILEVLVVQANNPRHTKYSASFQPSFRRDSLSFYYSYSGETLKILTP